VSLVHINRPRWILKRRIKRCPTCECCTEFVVTCEVWYASMWLCCRCGDGWGEEGLMPRPFARGWRKDAVREHRRMWDQATYGPFPTLQELDPEWQSEHPVEDAGATL